MLLNKQKDKNFFIKLKNYLKKYFQKNTFMYSYKKIYTPRAKFQTSKQ